MKIISLLKSLPKESINILRRTPSLVFAMGVLSLGGFIGASTVLVRGISMADNYITVTGTSTETIISDIARWTVQVRTSGDSQINSFNNHKLSLEKTMQFLI